VPACMTVVPAPSHTDRAVVLAPTCPALVLVQVSEAPSALAAGR